MVGALFDPERDMAVELCLPTRVAPLQALQLELNAFLAESQAVAPHQLVVSRDCIQSHPARGALAYQPVLSGSRRCHECGDAREAAQIDPSHRRERLAIDPQEADGPGRGSGSQARSASGTEVHEVNSLDANINGTGLLSQIDCIYMTRIQREHNSTDTEQEIAAIDLEPFRLTVERVGKLKQFTPIMHPFPRDSVVGEIPTAVDSDPRAMYFRQARNGMWARAALLVHLFDAADSLYFSYSDVMRSRV